MSAPHPEEPNEQRVRLRAGPMRSLSLHVPVLPAAYDPPDGNLHIHGLVHLAAVHADLRLALALQPSLHRQLQLPLPHLLHPLDNRGRALRSPRPQGLPPLAPQKQVLPHSPRLGQYRE